MVREKENYSGSQNSKSNGLDWKFFAEVKTEKGQALTPIVLTGIRAAIHHHLTCAPPSRNTNILQDSEFISANTMFEAKAKLFTKRCETGTQIIYSVRRYAEIESILHGRAEHGRRLEKCGEVGWVCLVFSVLSFCSLRQRVMAGAYEAVIWNKNWWHWSPLRTYDLALCIDNNDNKMTFIGHWYSLFVARVASFAPSLRSGANDTTRATNQLYALQKSCDCQWLSYYRYPSVFCY